MDEKEMVLQIGSLMRAYSYDFINGGVLGPFEDMLTLGYATVTMSIKHDQLIFTKAETHEGEVTNLSTEVESLQATIKEQEKTIKSQKKTIATFETQTTKETPLVSGDDLSTPTTSDAPIKPRRVKK